VMLGVTVPFPVSLILNKRVITKYQLLFRHLLHCKNIERLLSLTWMLHSQEKSAADHCNRGTSASSVSSSSSSLLSSKRTSSSSRMSRSTESLKENSNPRTPLSASVSFLHARKSSKEDDPTAANLTDEEKRERLHFSRRMSLLRSRMLHFIQQFLHFVCFEVVDPHWRLFEVRLAEVNKRLLLLLLLLF
jgi:gamma-tubulin complex component 2